MKIRRLLDCIVLPVLLLSLAAATSPMTAKAAFDASDGECEGIGVITLGPGGTLVYNLRCVDPCDDTCEKSAITIPGVGTGVVCRCETAPYQYCCQLALLDTGVLSPVGDCSQQDGDCDAGNTCTGAVAFGTAQEPYPAIVTNKCKWE